MLRSARRFLSAAITALASHGFSQSAPPTADTVQVMTDADVSLREIEYDNLAVSVRPELLAKYAGDMKPITPELIAAMRSARKWRNTTIGGAREEFDQFVEARMR